jgi:hypothetical protein
MDKTKLTGYLPPRPMKQDIVDAINRASQRINNMSPEEKRKHFRELEYEQARISQHSWEVHQGELETLAKMDRNYIPIGFNPYSESKK